VIVVAIVIAMAPALMLFCSVLFYVLAGPARMILAWHKKRVLRRTEPIPEEDLVIRG
jgi:hypothetical protein